MTNLTVTTEDGTFNVAYGDVSDELYGLELDPGYEYTRADAEVFDDLVFALCEVVPGDGEFISVVAA